MTYTKSDLVEASGLPDRTIRNYIARGLLPRPKGHGLAAEYSEECMLRAIAIARMRSQGVHIDVITDRIAGWPIARFRRFVAETEPPTPTTTPDGSPPRYASGTGR